MTRCAVCGNRTEFCACAATEDLAVLDAAQLPDGTVVRRRLHHLALIVTEDQQWALS